MRYAIDGINAFPRPGAPRARRNGPQGRPSGGRPRPSRRRRRRRLPQETHSVYTAWLKFDYSLADRDPPLHRFESWTQYHGFANDHRRATRNDGPRPEPVLGPRGARTPGPGRRLKRRRRNTLTSAEPSHGCRWRNRGTGDGQKARRLPRPRARSSASSPTSPIRRPVDVSRCLFKSPHRRRPVPMAGIDPGLRRDGQGEQRAHACQRSFRRPVGEVVRAPAVQVANWSRQRFAALRSAVSKPSVNRS
jgi:hypothetical protein